MKFNLSISLAVISTLLIISSNSAFAIWAVDPYGVITITNEGQVLGKKSLDTPADQNNNSRSSTNADSTNAKVKINTHTNNSKTQIKIDTQATSSGSVKVVPVKDKLKITLYENHQNVDINTPSETDALTIEDTAASYTTTIRSHNQASYIIRNKIAAQSHFPIMVNLETNELMITTPKGTKTVTVLPDKAVEHMLAANVLDQLGGKGGLQWLAYQEQLKQASGSGEMERERNRNSSRSGDLRDDDSATDSSNLEDDQSASSSASQQNHTSDLAADEADIVVDLITTTDGTLAYEIQGIKNEKFLGLTQVNLHRKVVVSAETGELLHIIQDFRTRLLDFFSF